MDNMFFRWNGEINNGVQYDSSTKMAAVQLKKIFDEFLSAGFTEEQTMKIISAMIIGGMGDQHS